MPGRRTITIFLAVIGIVILYAFAVEKTEINLERPLDPARQEGVIRVLRLLSDPDFFDKDPETGRLILSEASETTLERIVETILMALMASTFGTIFAVPVSFLAARNLMENVTMPLAGIMAALIALPVGVLFGTTATRGLLDLTAVMSNQTIIGFLFLIGTVVLLLAFRRIGLGIGRPGSTNLNLIVRAIIVFVLIILSLGLLAHLGGPIGEWLEDNLGFLGFLGNFIVVLSDFVLILLPPTVGIIIGILGTSLGARFGQEAVLTLPLLPSRIITAVLAGLGSAVLIFGIGKGLDWLYQYNNPENVTIIPAAIGAAVMTIIGILIAPKRPFRIGFIIYTISRSILNALRAIEPLILGIVFVVWVSLGPFAGVMALTLHSIAALGKLFSEQVEGISDGPIEAIIATGANRVQMVVFAVIPQIIPPFLAFTFYRWDINVRMSTIIGFIGGGGIGFVLSQNIRQLRYSQASVMMLAIAIVVATLDYASSKIRSRII